MRLFDVEVSSREGGGVTLELQGELDLSTIGRLEQAIARDVNGLPETVVLDLRRLVFLDSTGLRLILRLHESLRISGGRLVLVEGPRRIQRVLELTGAVDELEIVSDQAEIDVGASGSEQPG